MTGVIITTRMTWAAHDAVPRAELEHLAQLYEWVLSK
jgi:hypothetical protein